MINNHIEYDALKGTWDYMRDAWLGEDAIKFNAYEKTYAWKKESMSDKDYQFMLFNGRYPEIVNRLIRSSVDRSLSREPDGIQELFKVTDDPYQLLAWMLTEISVTGGLGLALNMQDKIRVAPYSIEKIINWSDSSIAILDKEYEHDMFGFVEDYVEVVNIIHLGSDGFAYATQIDDNGDTGPAVPFLWNGRQLGFIPAVRVSSINKPLFHGLAKSAEHYFRVSALRMFIMNLVVPQPVLTLPPADEVDTWNMEKMMEEGGKIQYGVGSFMKLPNGATFDIKTANVRSLGEFRHELASIKDEMVVQGAQMFLQKAGQINNVSQDSVRLHISEESLLFNDVKRQCENAVNQILQMYSILQNEPFVPFKFKPVEINQIDIEDMVKAATIIGDEAVQEELEQRLIGIEDAIEQAITPQVG